MNQEKLLEKLFADAGESQVKASYNRYQDFYKSASLDYEDVCQEIRMDIWKNITEDKIVELSYPEQCKYIGASVRNCLNTILHNSCKLELARGLLAFADEEKSDEDILVDLEVRMIDADEKNMGNMLEILRRKFIDNQSERVIAKEMGITYNVVRGTYETCLRRYSKNKAHKRKNERFTNLNDDERSDEDSMEDCVDLGTMEMSSMSVQPQNDTFFILIKDHLTPFEFSVLECTYKDQLEVREIANLLKVSTATVSRAHNSALEKLKRKLGNFVTK